nr:ISNCY family transposase [Parvularcula lutaonensis]
MRWWRRSRTARQAAGVLGLSVRQVQRLKKRMAEEGPSGLAHKLRGRSSNRKISPRVQEWALGLIREKYADYGPTLAAETLEEVHGFKVGRETLRRWMIHDGLWLSRKERKRFQQPRLRREHIGELVQIDGSEHRWFEERGAPCSLLVFIDDATSRLQKLWFCEAESTFSYFQALEGDLTEHGRPLALYSDKHSVFKLNRPSKRSGETMTQFGRALAELQIEIICADTSQAKGRVERANRTLQDRLVKALRAEGISTINEANAFLPGFVERFNAKFARRPAKETDLHRPLRQSDRQLREVLCLKIQRYVGGQLTVTYDRKKIILDPEGTAKGLVGKYVDIHQYADGSFSIVYAGEALPHKIFDNAQ